MVIDALLNGQTYPQWIAEVKKISRQLERQKPTTMFYPWFDIRGTVAHVRHAVEQTETPDRHYCALLEVDPSYRPLLVAYAFYLVEAARAQEALPFIDIALSACHADLWVQELYEAAHLQISHGTSRGGMVDPALLKDYFCPAPFERFETKPTGGVFNCCPSRLPIRIGNIFEQDVKDIWHGKIAQALRDSVLDGSYRYCSRMHCNYLLRQKLPRRSEAPRDYLANKVPERPIDLDLSHDRSCNLFCASCRDKRFVAKGETARRLAGCEDMFVDLVNHAHAAIITSSGDPFASKHFRSILSRIDPLNKDQFSLSLYTNAILFTPTEWDKLSRLHGLSLFVLTSVDAAKKETYEKLRRGGKFEQLQANLSFIGAFRREGKIKKFELFFVVQEENWREMKDFILWALSLSVDTINFQRIRKWEVLSVEAYRRMDVCLPTHPDHAAFREMLKDPIFQTKGVLLGTIPLFENEPAVEGLEAQAC